MMARPKRTEPASDDLDWLEGLPVDPTVTDKHGLAAMLGVAPKDVDRMIREGLPTFGERTRGAALQFRVPDCVRWLVGQQGDALSAAKLRQMEATAAKREAEAARIEGRFVDIAVVEDVIRDQVARLQGELLAIPERLPPDAREAARAEIHGAINRLAFERLNYA